MSVCRVPPYNNEAEIAVLGSILLNNKSWGDVYAILDPEDFYVSANRLIFESMGELFSSGTAVDPITLGHELRQKGNLQKIGGAVAISNILDTVATTANVSYYSDIVKETSQIRKLIYEAQEVSAKGYGGFTVEELSEGMEGLVRAAHALGKRKMPHSVPGLGPKVLENYKLVAGGYRGIELPWKTIDNMTAGLWPKTVTMFVARPSAGKSMVCIICARHAWLSGKRVLIVSPEMDKEEMAERFFVVHAGVSYQDVISGQLPTTVEKRFEQTIKDNKELKDLYILDAGDDLSPKGIDAAIRACDPHLVAIDAMYDLKIKGERRDRMLAALEWTKNNCKEHGYAAVGFAQQNRIAELSEKKGGGARLGTIALADEIGQDAQNVFALEQTKDDKADHILKLKPLKIRRGQFIRDSVRIHWDFDQMIFSELPSDDDSYDDGDIPF